MSRWRGHRVVLDYPCGRVSRYADTHEVTTGGRRPCGHCGLGDTPEGHDGCLGALPGVTNACCGHGYPRLAYVQVSRYLSESPEPVEHLGKPAPRTKWRDDDAAARLVNLPDWRVRDILARRAVELRRGES